MSNELSAAALRTKIINLITNTLSDETSDLTKTLTAKINALTKTAIDADNENDINWDETDQLFGDYTGTTPTVPTPTVTPSSTVTPTPQTSVPTVKVSAKNDREFAPGNTILIMSGRGDSTDESISVMRLPYTCALAHDVQQVVIVSNNYNWSIRYNDGRSKNYTPGNECIINNISSLYNATITIDTEIIP